MEREPWSNMRGVYGVPRHDPDSSPDPAPEAYAHTRSAHRPPAAVPTAPRSSFHGGTTVIATASARDPSNPDPIAVVPILVGLDSYSDVTVAARSITYNIRTIEDRMIPRSIFLLPFIWSAVYRKKIWSNGRPTMLINPSVSPAAPISTWTSTPPSPPTKSSNFATSPPNTSPSLMPPPVPYPLSRTTRPLP
jgi:hypothetical protein